VTPLRQQHSQQQPIALLLATVLLPKAAAAGSQLRQPHNRAAAAGSSGRLPTSIRRHYDDTEQACATVGHQSGVARLGANLVPPSPPSGAQANPIDAEADQVSEGKAPRVYGITARDAS